MAQGWVGFGLMTVWMLVGDGDIAISQPSRLSGDSDYVVQKWEKDDGYQKAI